ncbi:MAG: TetR/AcrR family transcriptional regulator [Desulfatiglans sp.]|jgi:AcrR family transcriptional regulator|nr:TetR/AcrR family transcriptional regulator [Thermodesulfobacteriota bacterium]MEE4351694.1 TetR/AcrR family transcriptional regulator [Desulfatiglans sp.]
METNENNVSHISHSPSSTIVEKLEAAVRKAFSDQDFHQADMRSIAQNAGVSLATIYKYYGNKEKLLFAFVDKWMGSLANRQIDHLQGLESLQEKMRKICWIQLDFYEKNHDIGKIIWMTTPLKTWMSDKTFEQKKLMSVYGEVFKEGQDKGYLRDGVSPHMFVDILFGVVWRMFTMWVYRGQKNSLVGQSKILFEVVWSAIAKPD